MKTRVVSLMWGTAWERYGAAFAFSFLKYWPGSVELAVVTDRELSLLAARITELPLDAIGGVKAFPTDDRARGLNPPAGSKVDERGYSWRHDALKWMPQALAPRAALEGLSDGDIFCWLDADVETIAKVPEGWLDMLLDGHDVAMLQRTGTHSEIGFYALRLGPGTRHVLDAFAAFYTTGAVFALKEWHSAFVFDQALADWPGLRIRNLAMGKGHVWPRTVLAQYTVHKKGKRKDK